MKKNLLIIFVVLSFMLAGCTKTVGYVDESKKKTLEEVKEYTTDELRNKYNIEVDIIDVEIRDVSYCNGSIDGSCLSKRLIKGAQKYIVKCKTSDGVEFEAVYTDAYTNKDKDEYKDIEFRDTYEYNNKNSKLNNDLLYNSKRIMDENDIKGTIYKSFESNSSHDFTILINIKDISKIEKYTKELNEFILESYNKDDYIYYFLFISDEKVLNSIKDNNITHTLAPLKEYKFTKLYSNDDSINNNEYNNYTKDNKYNNYIISTKYSHSKQNIKIESNIYGIELTNNNDM